jgi:hypothetical protein
VQVLDTDRDRMIPDFSSVGCGGNKARAVVSGSFTALVVER